MVDGKVKTSSGACCRQLRQLLEVTNMEVGDNWFRSAAYEFAEALDAQYIAITECVNGSVRELASHAVWKEGDPQDNFVYRDENGSLKPVLDGGNIVLGAPGEIQLPSSCPFRCPELPFLRGVTIRGNSGDTVGVIIIGSKKAIVEQEDVRIIFEIFASRAAAEIARLHYDRSREAELKRITMLQRISQAASNYTDPDQVLDIAAEEIGRVFNVSRCVIHRKDGESGFPVVAEYVQAPFSSMKGVKVPRQGNDHAEEVMNSDECVAISDVYQDPRLANAVDILRQCEIKSMLSARTSFENEANGAIGLQHCGDTPRHWTSEEVNLLGAVVANVGVAIAQAELKKREKNHNEVIEEALREARAASKAKGDFLARMSHELRTPMNSILGFSQLLSADKKLTEEQKETLAIINRSGEHLMLLINDVLEMSKIESGKQDINLSTFSPEKLVKGLAELFAIRADAKGLVLRTRLPENFPSLIEGDENKLRQIITNLLGNAIKFTSQGGVELRGWYFKKKGVGEDQGILAFSVRDSGCGMSAEDQEELFTPFVQSKAGIQAREGTGLGLTITKSFVELMGGEIKAESVAGKGSEFSFWVKCREVKEKFSEKELSDSITSGWNSAAAPRGRILTEPPTILVADDQPENRLLVVRCLSNAGYTLVEAVDGQDAIDVFRTSRPEAVLMDVQMPGTDGLAATRTIRGMKNLESQPYIIALTGNAFEDDRRKALQAGCDNFLAKPFKLDDLLNILKQHVGVPAAKAFD